LLIYN